VCLKRIGNVDSTQRVGRVLGRSFRGALPQESEPAAIGLLVTAAIGQRKRTLQGTVFSASRQPYTEVTPMCEFQCCHNFTVAAHSEPPESFFVQGGFLPELYHPLACFFAPDPSPVYDTAYDMYIIVYCIFCLRCARRIARCCFADYQ